MVDLFAPHEIGPRQESVKLRKRKLNENNRVHSMNR